MLKKKEKHIKEQQESTRETRTHTHGEETGKRGKSYTVSREDDKLYGLTTNRFYPFGRSSTQEQHHHHHHRRRCLTYHHQSTPQTSLTFPSSHTHKHTSYPHPYGVVDLYTVLYFYFSHRDHNFLSRLFSGLQRAMPFGSVPTWVG